MSVIYIKIQQKEFRNSCSKPYWTIPFKHELYGKCYKNLNGGFITSDLVDKELETCTVDDEIDFINKHRKEIYDYLINEKSKYGWLSPKCEFLGCDYTNHSNVAELYLGLDEIELEKNGWIKVFKEYNSDKAVYSQFTHNERQLKWLFNHNVEYSKYAY